MSLPEAASHSLAVLDNWRPLLSVAALISETCKEAANKAMTALNNAFEEEGVVTRLLVALRNIYQERGMTEMDDFLKSEDLVQTLNEDKEAPWSDWRNGSGISEKKLANVLKPFKVKSEQHQSDQDRGKGYWFRDLKKVLERYL
jgi:thymidylate synthase